MGNKISPKIAELRALTNPQNPEQSDHVVMYPITVTNAVIDLRTGKALGDMLKEQSEAITEFKMAIAELRGEN